MINSLTAQKTDAVDEIWDMVLKTQNYVNPKFVGPLGVMKMLHVVGQQYRPVGSVPEKLTSPLELRLEPENKFDPQAISVWHDGQQIGYVAKNHYLWLHRWWNDFNPDLRDSPKLVSGVKNDRI